MVKSAKSNRAWKMSKQAGGLFRLSQQLYFQVKPEVSTWDVTDNNPLVFKSSHLFCFSPQSYKENPNYWMKFALKLKPNSSRDSPAVVSLTPVPSPLPPLPSSIRPPEPCCSLLISLRCLFAPFTLSSNLSHRWAPIPLKSPEHCHLPSFA